MNYIGLLNESHMTTYTNVSASADLTVGTSLRNLGLLSQIGPPTSSGSLLGLLTTVCHGVRPCTLSGGIWEWARRGTWEAEAPGSPSAYRPPDP